MKLELAKFSVKKISFGKQINYGDGSLEINKAELVNLIKQDEKIISADVEIVRPGEEVRVINIRDIIEPRVKISGASCVFPGVMGPPDTAGDGVTNALTNMTVMVSAEYKPIIMSGTAAQNSSILDMWGPGAEITPFGKTLNVIVIIKLADGVTEWEAHTSIQAALFKVANRLAETTRDKQPAEIEVMELVKSDPSLPRVMYIAGCLTMLGEPHSHVAYYGLPIQECMPIYMHPNEFFDGAVTTDARRGNGGFTSTWDWMQLPVARNLLREHGKRVNFIGVLLQRTRFESEFGKKVSATCASGIAKLLGAEGAIITRTIPSGNNFMEAMITAQACEKKGIQTVIATPEWGGTEGNDLPLVYYVPEAVAMVSMGSHERILKLPKPSKVLGIAEGQLARLYVGDPPFDPWDTFVTNSGVRDIIGGIDWFGHINLTCTPY